MKYKLPKMNETNIKTGQEIKANLSKQSKKIEKKPISMHEDVPVWYDCCSCEAEPYWLEAMQAKDDKKAGSL